MSEQTDLKEFLLDSAVSPECSALLAERRKLLHKAVLHISPSLPLSGRAVALRILQRLSHDEMTPTGLVSEHRANQSSVSGHLQVLLDAGIVACKEGNRHLYSVADSSAHSRCDPVYLSTITKARARSASNRTPSENGPVNSRKLRRAADTLRQAESPARLSPIYSIVTQPRLSRAIIAMMT